MRMACDIKDATPYPPSHDETGLTHTSIRPSFAGVVYNGGGVVLTNDNPTHALIFVVVVVVSHHSNIYSFLEVLSGRSLILIGIILIIITMNRVFLMVLRIGTSCNWPWQPCSFQRMQQQAITGQATLLCPTQERPLLLQHLLDARDYMMKLQQGNSTNDTSDTKANNNNKSAIGSDSTCASFLKSPGLRNASSLSFRF